MKKKIILLDKRFFTDKEQKYLSDFINGDILTLLVDFPISDCTMIKVKIINI